MNGFPSFCGSSGSKKLRMKRIPKAQVLSFPLERLSGDQSYQLASWGARILFQAGGAISFWGRVIYLLTPGASPERQPTCAKYSSEILPAHSMHRSRGRQGLATSAHLIIMRLIRVWFSGKFFPGGLHSQSLPSIWKADEGWFNPVVKPAGVNWLDTRWPSPRPPQAWDVMKGAFPSLTPYMIRQHIQAIQTHWASKFSVPITTHLVVLFSTSHSQFNCLQSSDTDGHLMKINRDIVL